MMAVEGPFLAAVIARLPAPAENLAAFGVAFAAAVIVESPVIMLLSASMALVVDRQSFFALRRFTYVLCGVLTVAMVAAQLPAVSRPVFAGALDLPVDVADRTAQGFRFLIPWPAAIGYRRFYQGLLIRQGQTRWVGFGTVFRLGAMAAAALLLGVVAGTPHRPALAGASIACAALSAGVLTEAAVSRLVSRRAVRALLRHDAPVPEPLTARKISSFYVPLALTSALGMAVQPTITVLIAHGHRSLESLAVLPVANGVTFLFRSLGLSYHEAAVALLGQGGSNYRPVRLFAAWLAGGTTIGLGALVVPPLSTMAFERLAGLSPDLAALAILVTRIQVLLPALTVLLALQRAVLVRARRTRLVTASTAVEVSTIALVVWTGIFRLGLAGATAAAWGLMLGRVAGTAVLWPAASGEPSTAARSASSRRSRARARQIGR